MSDELLPKNTICHSLSQMSPLRRLAAQTASSPVCFVVSPIGEDRSETRLCADAILEQVIIPALDAKHGGQFEVRRVDRSGAQWISAQIVEEIKSSLLIVAVLTELNPNVFFEMGAAQAWRKPIVAMAQEGTGLPFDVKDLNTLFYEKPLIERPSWFDRVLRRKPDDLNARLRDAEVSRCIGRLRAMAKTAPDTVHLSPFSGALADIGSVFALNAIYAGKRFMLRGLAEDMRELISSFTADYEIAKARNPDGLRGLAPNLAENSKKFSYQSRALHGAMEEIKHLPKVRRDQCLALCDSMEGICRQMMLVASTLTKKQQLLEDDVRGLHEILVAVQAAIASCLETIHALQS